jgi:DNA polymerase III subunit chi
LTEVLFYHLTRTPLEVTLPELLAKTRARGWKALVRGGEAARLDWLDKRLWLACADTDFPAHGLVGGNQDADQPVLLSGQNGNPNNADILFAVDQAEVATKEAGSFTRVCVLFDGNDAAALNHARNQWKSLTDAGLPAKYWSQEDGGWQVKATKN